MPAEKPKMKSSKPLMEKRRRARINDSLMQLKNLVLDALNKNNSRHSKLEKADILEMTVRYLRTIQRQQISASVNADPAVLGQYRSGYAQCINEVTRYLGASGTPDDAPELRTRLVGHLANMCTTGQQLQQQQPNTTTAHLSPQQQQQSPVTYQLAQTTYHQQQQPRVEGAMSVPQMQVVNVQQSAPASVPVRIAPTPEASRADFSCRTSEPHGQISPAMAVHTQSVRNSSPAQVIQSVPVGVAPSSLPSGEITLVLPQEALPNGQVPTHFIPVYAPPGSAAVLSPPLRANNNHGSTPTPCHVSMSSPRAAATVPSMSPTGPQSSMTIPAQHAQVTHPSSSYQTQVTLCVPVQTKLSPIPREYTHQQPEPIAREHVAAHQQCVAKSDPMWRPW